MAARQTLDENCTVSVRHTGAGRRVVVWFSAAAAVVGGGLLVYGGATAHSGPPQPPASAGRAVSVTSARPSPRAAPSATDVIPALSRSRPTRVLIPRLRVNAPFTTVGLTANGALGTPPEDKANLAGWYDRGVAPGENGTAIIVGHVDTWHGPAVFYGLGALRPGDRITVDRADGRAATFTTYAVKDYAKSNFPAARIFSGTGYPEVRLVTCGGGFSRRTGYSANTVVFARLSASTTASRR